MNDCDVIDFQEARIPADIPLPPNIPLPHAGVFSHHCIHEMALRAHLIKNSGPLRQPI